MQNLAIATGLLSGAVVGGAFAAMGSSGDQSTELPIAAGIGTSAFVGIAGRSFIAESVARGTAVATRPAAGWSTPFMLATIGAGILTSVGVAAIAARD